MDWGWLASIGSSFLGGLKGGGNAAPPSGGAVISPEAVGSTGQSLGQSFGADAGNLLREGVIGRVGAVLSGANKRAYNEAAFPGLSSSDYAGSGAASGGVPSTAMESAALAQRERESQRSVRASLAQTRMQTNASLASSLIAQGNNGPLVAQLLRAGGVLPPEIGFDPRMMGRGVAEAGIAASDARTEYTRADTAWLPESRQSEINQRDTSASLTDQQANESRLRQQLLEQDAWLRPLDRWLESSKILLDTKLGPAKVLGIMSHGAAASLTAGEVARQLVKAGLPEGDAYRVSRYLPDIRSGK